MDLLELATALLGFLEKAGPSGAMLLFLYGLLKRDRWWVPATEHNLILDRTAKIEAENEQLRDQLIRILAINERTLTLTERTVTRES